MTNTLPKESARALLSEIIDYAGLFPPAQLSMPEAVLNYANYKNGNYNWMLGRFVAPVSRLEEFLESARNFFTKDTKKVWRLSVLASEDISETIGKIEDFNRKNKPYVVCDALEAKANTSSLVKEIAKATLPELATYVELPLGENLADMVSTLSVNHLRGKIRTGGTSVEAFPPALEILRFVQICLEANVPFKATAGLHHPLRCIKPLTYEADAPEDTMNGFLNLFLATGFAKENFELRLLEELMEDESPESFEFVENGITWRQKHFLSHAQLVRLRQQNIVSFGSCSFTEPIEDLQEIGIF